LWRALLHQLGDVAASTGRQIFVIVGWDKRDKGQLVPRNSQPITQKRSQGTHPPYDHRPLKTICFALLAAGAVSFFFIFLKGNGRSLSLLTAKRAAGISDTGFQGPKAYSRHKQPGVRTAHTPRKSLSSSLRDAKATKGEEIVLDGSATRRPFNLTDRLKGPTYFPSEIGLADIADYDALQHSYALKKIDLFANEGDIPTGLLSALKILNRKDVSSDYFRSWEYELAYNEIDRSYSDYYVWPYFTNREAKTNFFLYLFSKYAADNKKWRTYEKDVSDCSQFSQRVYLLMYPGEVSIPDEEYFRFLFSDESTRVERKKLCNKIPNIFYVRLTPYILKMSRSSDSPPPGHAMISFAPDGSLQDVILAEPQSGAFENLEGNPGNILTNEQLTRYPLICQLGKILSIEKGKSHEANIAVSGVYFFPRISSSDIQYDEDPRLDYEQKPILLQDQTYNLFQTISSYLERVLKYQSVDQIGFLHSLDSMIRDGQISLPQMESEIGSSTDIVMHGLITLDSSDLKRIKDEMEELKDLASKQPSLSPQVNNLVTKLNYLFLLKLEPLL
jgi:hypothetical protein